MALALLAALHKMLYASVLVNDDFMHRAYARQLVAGEWPVRDFFDYGMGLMYAMTALAEVAFGYRLFSEALVIAAMVGVSTYLVYDIVRRASGSVSVAALSAVLFVVATPRSYGYPKLIVYAVAAALWWQYVWKPGARQAIALGVWAAVSFFWRPDHGAYVAVGVTLAIIAAHGLRILTLTRCLQAGAVAVVLVAPWLAFASAHTGGLTAFVQSGLTAASEEHRSTGRVVPRWPLRQGHDIVRVDDAERYAPTIGMRWTRDSSAASREDVLRRYELAVVATRDDVSLQVRLSARALQDLRGLLAEPIVEDTDGVDRGAASVSSSIWPDWERWRFSHWWLRIRGLPGLDTQVEAGEAATILLGVLPLMAAGLGAVPRFRRHLPAGVSGAHLVCFSVFALVVDFGMLRTPFHVRAADVVVLPGIALGVLTAALQHATRASQGWGRWLPRAAAVIVVLLLFKSLAVAGQSGERVNWLAGEWSSLDRARGAWEEVSGRLSSSPPIDYWRNRKPEVTLRLAAYARECLPQSDRILVRWFAPEIYYYSDRLMAGRHAFFLTALGRLPHERQMELDKIRRSPPQIVFSKVMSDRDASETFPDLVDVVARDYRVGGWIDDGDRYLILVRRDRPPVRLYGDGKWPCFR